MTAPNQFDGAHTMFGDIPDFTKQMNSLVQATGSAMPNESLPRPSPLYNEYANTSHLAINQYQQRKHSTLPPNISNNRFHYDGATDTQRPFPNRIPDKDTIQVVSSSQDNLNDVQSRTADPCDSRNKDDQGMFHNNNIITIHLFVDVVIRLLSKKQKIHY